jgi:hypothetical protein
MIPERRQILHIDVCAALLCSWRRILLLPGAPSARRQILAFGSCAVLLHRAARNTLHLIAPILSEAALLHGAKDFSFLAQEWCAASYLCSKHMPLHGIT